MFCAQGVHALGMEFMTTNEALIDIIIQYGSMKCNLVGVEHIACSIISLLRVCQGALFGT